MGSKADAPASKPPMTGMPGTPELTTIHTVFLVGCDETTDVEIECTADELVFLKRLAAKTREHRPYDCYPAMAVDGAELAAVRGYVIKGET